MSYNAIEPFLDFKTTITIIAHNRVSHNILVTNLIALFCNKQIVIIWCFNLADNINGTLFKEKPTAHVILHRKPRSCVEITFKFNPIINNIVESLTIIPLNIGINLRKCIEGGGGKMYPLKSRGAIFCFNEKQKSFQ